jgi:hypothetical protein
MGKGWSRRRWLGGMLAMLAGWAGLTLAPGQPAGPATGPHAGDLPDSPETIWSSYDAAGRFIASYRYVGGRRVYCSLAEGRWRLG